MEWIVEQSGREHVLEVYHHTNKEDDWFDPSESIDPDIELNFRSLWPGDGYWFTECHSFPLSA